VANYIPTTNYDIQVSKNVIDILEENGISYVVPMPVAAK
jgi:hypothetical protein